MQKRRNDVKARTTLLLALPDEHQLRFCKYKTAQELWAAILKTFGGNKATKKTKKNLLKQSDLDTISLDDLYNHLKVYEPEVQKKSDSQNMAFISSAKNSSGNREVNTASILTTSTQVSPASANVAATSISLDTACAYIASQSSDTGRRLGKRSPYKVLMWLALISQRWNALTATRWATLLRSAGHPGAKTGVENFNQGSKVEESAPKSLMVIDGVGWDWSYMANEEEDHALVADQEAPTKFALMAKSSSDTEEARGLTRTRKDWDTVLFPPPAQVYSPPKKDISWTGLPKFADDTIIDYSRPSPNIESKSNVLQNNSTSISENGESTSSILSKPEIKFVKAADSPTRCSRHMTSNISYLSDYEPYDGGYVSFGQGGCKITGKGTIKTECIVLGRDFKLRNDVNVLLRIPRQHNMYSIDLNNIIPHKDLTCLVTKASTDESELWHRRLGHLNFKIMNRLVRHNLVKGLPSKCFDNDHTCVACLKEKQHKASCKTKLVNSMTKPLHTLHMDLFGPTSVSSLNQKWYCLVVTKDFSRNKEMNDFCSRKRITREFSNAKTPQQNEVAERRNKTLIEAARAMLADAKLPVTFWAEAVNTTCYVQNRVLVNKSQNKTPYELFNGRTPFIRFLKPFGCQVMILNTLDNLGKFEAKGDEGYFIGYSMSSKAFRVFNKRTKRVKENLHVEFLENKLIEKGAGPNWLFNIDTLTNSMNYMSVMSAGTTSTNFSCTKEAASQDVKKDVSSLRYIALPIWFHEAHLETSTSNAQDTCKADALKSSGNSNPTATSTNPPTDDMETLTVENPILTVSSPVPTACLDDSPQLSSDTRLISKRVTSQDNTPSLDNILTLSNRFEDILRVTTNTGDSHEVEADLGNMEDNISASPTPTLKVHKDHPTSQIIGPVDTLDLEFPARVYKVEKAMYGLHQAPRAWYATLSKYLLTNSFQRGTIDQTLFIRKHRGYFILVQVRRKAFFLSQDKYVGDILKKFRYSDVRSANTPMDKENPWGKDRTRKDIDLYLYRSMIGSLMYLTASRPDIMFAVCTRARHQVTPKECHLLAVKRIIRYLKGHLKLGVWYPKDSPFDLVAYSDSDYGGATQDRKSTTGGCQLLGRRLISWQCKKQTIMATSTTEAEYVVAASGCGQVLGIQNQLLDYWYNFMNTKIYIDNNSAICIVKNLVYHSKTKHIEIRHHFIRDCFEKKLISVDHIHIDDNVADLLTRPFDAGRYALTINPTVYVSHIRQFWSTARIETTDERTKILATVDGKPRTISESSIRRNLKLKDEAGISFLPDAELFKNCTLMGYNISPNQKFSFQKGEPVLLSPLALLTIADEPASPFRDDSQGEACPTVSGLEAEQDRANIIKTSTLPSDLTPRVTLLAADEGNMQQKLNELMDLYKDRGGDEPSGEDATIKGRSLETGDEAYIERSMDKGSNDTDEMVNFLTSLDASSILTSGAQVSVPPAAEVATINIPPAGEIPTVSVSTGSGVVPTASPIFTTATVATPYSRRKGKEKMVESETPKKKKLQEQLDVQMARQLEEEMARDAQRMNEQIARDAEIARIHAEEELERIELINDLVKYQDNYPKVLKYQSQQRKPLSKKKQREFYMSVLRSHAGWKTKHFKGMSLEELREKFDPVWKQIEDFVPMGSKEEGEIFKKRDQIRAGQCLGGAEKMI
nr:hypothetical protein [Tanacetum cinerariifolium]